MQVELEYFKVGKTFGGNQNELSSFTMRMGGCASVTACDLCIYMSLFQDNAKLYPYDNKKLTAIDYNTFNLAMKPYLRPRFGGINTLTLYVEGIRKYLSKVEEDSLEIAEFSGSNSLKNAITQVKQTIGQGIPIPFLLLRHRNVKFKQLVWHWFLIVGYEECENDLYVKIVTYGTYFWFSLKELWDTGYRKTGGMILVQRK